MVHREAASEAVFIPDHVVAAAQIKVLTCSERFQLSNSLRIRGGEEGCPPAWTHCPLLLFVAFQDYAPSGGSARSHSDTVSCVGTEEKLFPLTAGDGGEVRHRPLLIGREGPVGGGSVR